MEDCNHNWSKGHLRRLECPPKSWPINWRISMKSGKCPKCGAADVRLQKGMSQRDDLRVSVFSGVALCDYICGQCGYVESYVVAEDLELIRKKVPAMKAEA